MESNINQVYKKYFELIDSFFGSIKHHLGSEEDSHIDLGIKMASYPLISDLILDAIDDLDEEIDKFWRENAKEIFDSIKKQDSLKCLYSGDISPVILEKFVKRSSLYIDTVILPDPLFNLALLQKQIIADKKYYLNKLIRHVFNIWKLKDLILADTEKKILAVVPVNLYLVSEKDRNELLDNADNKFTDYINRVFSLNLSSKQECFDYLNKYNSGQDIFGGIKNKELLPNIFKTQDGLNNFISDFTGTEKFSKVGKNTPGWNFSLYVNSQFIRVQEHKFFCEQLSAEPIYDYELPWFFFNYEIGGLDMDAAISNALQRENFDWIGSNEMPLSVFKQFREENKLDYMRNILRKGITDLKAKKDVDLVNVSEQLEKNLKEAFEHQNKEVLNLKIEASKIAKKEIPITVSGFLAGFIPAISNIVSVVTAGRDIKKLFSERKNLQQTVVIKEGSLINLLMKSYANRRK